MADVKHLLGLLLGTEEDWPRAFEHLVRRLDPALTVDGTTHRYDVERITIEPFDLRQPSRYDLVVDRLAYWYYVPREWLKKVALMDDTYLLNNPFTFQSMEKHAAYCAMIRLGLEVPETWLVPHKQPPDNAALPLHRGEVQPAVRPRAGGREGRLPALHEALRRRRLGRRHPDPGRAGPAPGLRRERPAADAPAGERRGLRRLRPVAVDRRRDDGHELRPGQADARPLLGVARLPDARRPAPRCRPSARSSTPSSSGSSTPARRSCATAGSSRSTTPTPAPTSPSPRCTTTSRGP